MFNLIAVILSITLATIITLTTAYYLGEVSRNSSAYVVASEMSNQASQIWAAATLYHQDNTKYPATVDDLIPKYLSNKPRFIQTAEAHPLPVAYAENVVDYELVHDQAGVLAYIVLPSAVPLGGCQAVVQRNTGNENRVQLGEQQVPTELKLSLIQQCVSEQEAYSYFWKTPSPANLGEALLNYATSRGAPINVEGTSVSPLPSVLASAMLFCEDFSCNSASGIAVGALQVGTKVLSSFLNNRSTPTVQPPASISGTAIATRNVNMGSYGYWKPFENAQQAGEDICEYYRQKTGTNPQILDSAQLLAPTGSSDDSVISLQSVRCHYHEFKYPINTSSAVRSGIQNFYGTYNTGYGGWAPNAVFGTCYKLTGLCNLNNVKPPFQTDPSICQEYWQNGTVVNTGVPECDIASSEGSDLCAPQAKPSRTPNGDGSITFGFSICQGKAVSGGCQISIAPSGEVLGNNCPAS